MSQLQKLFLVLSDGEIHTVPELLKKVYGIKKPSSARLAARIYDLRQRGYKILSDAVEGKSTSWWYRLIREKNTVWKESGKHRVSKV